MSFASTIGSIIGTTTAYVVHYGARLSSPLGVITVIYTHRSEIADFAAQHALKDQSPDGVSDNLFECLDYLE